MDNIYGNPYPSAQRRGPRPFSLQDALVNTKCFDTNYSSVKSAKHPGRQQSRATTRALCHSNERCPPIPVLHAGALVPVQETIRASLLAHQFPPETIPVPLEFAFPFNSSSSCLRTSPRPTSRSSELLEIQFAFLSKLRSLQIAKSQNRVPSPIRVFHHDSAPVPANEIQFTLLCNSGLSCQRPGSISRHKSRFPPIRVSPIRVPSNSPNSSSSSAPVPANETICIHLQFWLFSGTSTPPRDTLLVWNILSSNSC